jgi:hypothetical protein
LGAWISANFLFTAWISTHLFLGAWIIGVLFGALILGVVIWYQRSLKSLTNELVKSEIKLSIQESISNLAYTSFLFLLFAEIVSGWMVYNGLKMANDKLNIIPFVLGIGILVFGVLSCITVTYIIVLKIKRRDS